MRFRKLRIAWSVAWGVLALLLIALWVRSYWHRDLSYVRVNGTHYQVGSVGGRVKFVVQDSGNVPRDGFGATTMQFEENEDQVPWIVMPSGHSTAARFWYYHVSGFGNTPPYLSLTEAVTPHWFLALIAGALTAIPWVKWSARFSIRTLLIILTLAAIWIEIIRYASKKY